MSPELKDSIVILILSVQQYAIEKKLILPPYSLSGVGIASGEFTTIYFHEKIRDRKFAFAQIFIA